MKKPKRDMQAKEKTLAYFVSRNGKPTSIKQAARALKVPSTRLHTRVAELTKQGHLTRIDRGVYVSLLSAQPVVADPNETLLGILLAKREQLDAKIEQVREVMKLHEEVKK